MNTQNNLMELASSSPFIREETVVHTVNGEAINGKFCLNVAAVLTFLGLKYKKGESVVTLLENIDED